MWVRTFVMCLGVRSVVVWVKWQVFSHQEAFSLIGVGLGCG
jgi:hypothetical protein